MKDHSVHVKVFIVFIEMDHLRKNIFSKNRVVIIFPNIFFCRKSIMKRILLLIVPLLLLKKSFAQKIFLPDSAQLEFMVTPVISELSIDGRLNEEEWNRSAGVSGFVQLEPQHGLPSNHKTVVKGVYNKKYLYIGFFCYSATGSKSIRVPDLKRDFAYKQHDMVAICFDGFNDKRNSMTFACNAYGAQKDYLAYDDIFFDSDWNGLWKVRTSQTDSGWYAEFEIPWKTLRYDGGINGEYHFNINFLRVKRSTNEISVWSPYPRSLGFNRMEFAGKMTGMEPPRKGTNIQINPYIMTSENKSKGSDVGNSTTSVIKWGGEVKWAVNPKSVLDLSLNTDFAQADADQQVNNISRFSVFFPEKRQFFLENASLFGVGLTGEGENGIGGSMYIQPFFSRRVGLDGRGTPIPINLGARLVTRTAKRTYGGLYVRQGGKDKYPPEHIFVGRYSENIGKSGHIGGIATFKNSGAANGVQGYNAYSYAIDGFFRINSKHSIATMVAGTQTSNVPSTGEAGYVQYNYTTDEITAWWTQVYIGNNYNPELGFISRNNTLATCPGVIFNLRRSWLPFRKTIRSFNPGVQAQIFHDPKNLTRQEEIITCNPIWFELQNGGNVLFGVTRNLENLQEPFVPLGIDISPGKYDFFRYFVAGGSDASKKLSFSARYEWGGYYNGGLNTLNAAFKVSPMPNISLNLNYNLNVFSNLGVAKEKTDISLYTVSFNISPTPQLQLTGLYQYSTFGKREAFTTKLAWEYLPLSYVYIVYNKRIFESISKQEEQGTVCKISLLKQF